MAGKHVGSGSANGRRRGPARPRRAANPMDMSPAQWVAERRAWREFHHGGGIGVFAVLGGRL